MDPPNKSGDDGGVGSGDDGGCVPYRHYPACPGNPGWKAETMDHTHKACDDRKGRACDDGVQ